MFSRSNKSPDSRTEMGVQAAPSILSPNIVVRGDVVSDGEIHLEGTVEGDIHAKVLMIGEGAVVKGEVVAGTVEVHGTIEGQIKARNVKLAEKAHVTGDVLHENLSIDNGAFLEGHCKRMTAPTAGPETQTETTNKAAPKSGANSAGSPPDPVSGLAKTAEPKGVGGSATPPTNGGSATGSAA